MPRWRSRRIGMVDALNQMAFCYILYSSSLDRYYIGSCRDLNMRFQNHLDKIYPNSFTSKANDWVIYYSIELLDISSAIRFEKHIKKMKSRKFIEKLKNSPELETNLKLIFSK